MEYLQLQAFLDKRLLAFGQGEEYDKINLDSQLCSKIYTSGFEQLRLVKINKCRQLDKTITEEEEL